MAPDIVKKNSNEFSAAKEVLNEVNNLEFKSGERDFYKMLLSGEHDTSKSYLWSALSSIADDLSEEMYEKVLNYIEDVSDVDTCTVKSLQSMIQSLGTDFSIIDSVNSYPLEIQKALDVFSMRKDKLLDSASVCRQLAERLSCIPDAASPELSDGILSAVPAFAQAEIGEINAVRQKLSADLVSSYSAIDNSKLDTIVSGTYYSILTSNISLHYNTISSEVIYQTLSTAILCAGFELSDKYHNEAYAAKVRFHIPASFDQSDEIDLIEQGLSSIDSYSAHEKEILSIELKRRSDARSDLEPQSRYSYYREAKVREYFQFVETQYNSLSDTYSNSSRYAADKSYLELSSFAGYRPLMDQTGAINWGMVQQVAIQLLALTNAIRGIREHIKSHPQRTFMKGTQLLVQFVINEYIRNNIYPSMNRVLADNSCEQVSYSSAQTKLNIAEYIDQTQYNNLHTDIKEDTDDKTVNPEFWIGNSAEGNGDSLDTTNIFKAEEKARVLNSSTFSQDQIYDFYTNTLHVFDLAEDDNSRSQISSQQLYSFLSSVHAVGADNTWLDSNGKVMCELKNIAQTSSVSSYLNSRRFTIDIDNYIAQLSGYYDAAQYILSGYSPAENVTINSQLDDALAAYRAKIQETFDAELKSISESIDSNVSDALALRSTIVELKSEFDKLTASFTSLTATYLQYTGSYKHSTSEYFADELANYALSVDEGFEYIVPSVKYDLSRQIIAMQLSYSSIFSTLKLIRQTRSVATQVKAYDVHVYGNPPHVTANISYKTTALAALVPQKFEGYFESLYEKIDSLLTQLELQLSAQKIECMQQIQSAITSFLMNGEFRELNTLSADLEPYYSSTFSLLKCVDEISADLDYTQDSWYKYKVKLFKKYSGQMAGETPYQQIENKKHPSYQLHPCLSNFVEKTAYSYPLDNLAGLDIKAIENTAQSSSSLCIDADGYLVSVWCNPLNGNADYLSRYEKEDHLDARGVLNCVFGYDGPFYPRATADAELAAVIESLSPEKDVNSSWYAGLNITDKEKAQLHAKLSSLSSVIKIVARQGTDIIRYGLDIYGNCYSLIKCNVGAIDTTTLWVKSKNHPYAFPAFVFNADGSLDTAKSWFAETAGTSNQLVNTAKKVSIGGVQMPSVLDFTFSSDKSVILLECEMPDGTILPVHGVISQEHIKDEVNDNYVREFRSDPVSKSESLLSTDCNIGCFYYDGARVGNVYWKMSGTDLKLSVDSYLKNEDTTYVQTSAEAVVSGIKAIGNNIKFDCAPNGVFSIAYLSSGALPDTYQVQTASQTAQQYFNAQLAAAADTHDKMLVTRDFQLIGSTIVDRRQAPQAYLPYVDMGFVPVFNGSPCTIVGTALQNDLDAGKPMKFQLFGESCNENQGIDFKFVCPLRIYSGHQNWKDGEAEISPSYIDSSYHRDGTQNARCYRFEDLHYIESEIDKYLLGNKDAEYWDSTDIERALYLSSDSSTGDFGDFLTLANYDVHSYLSSRTDSEADAEEISMMTYPFLVDESDLTAYLNTYVTGKYSGPRTISHGTHMISIDGAQLSVSWMKNDRSTTSPDYTEIKLDFNAVNYVTASDNARNKNHLFLNLDRPGDAGYLKVYNSNLQRWYVLLIKNISMQSCPRFVMKSLDLDETRADSAIFSASVIPRKTGTAVNLIKAEGFETKFIQFT